VRVWQCDLTGNLEWQFHNSATLAIIVVFLLALDGWQDIQFSKFDYLVV